MKNNKSLYLIVGILIISLITLSIAFAALSATLSINFGNVNQSVQTWNVAFTGTSVSGTASGSASTTGRSCGNASIESNKVTVGDTQLSKPGDQCQWKLTVKNNGTIGAKLTSIGADYGSNTGCVLGGSNNQRTTVTCGNIIYTLTSDSNATTALPINTSLSSTNTQDVYVTAKFADNGTLNNGNQTIVQSGVSFTLNYTQN